MARGSRHQGLLGSLDNGTARPALSPDALARSRNTEHHKGGAIRNRPGRCVIGEVANAQPAYCAPFLESETVDPAGSFQIGETYYARFTYVTDAGETDDLHSSDPDGDGGPATLQWVAAAQVANIAVPFHMRRILVEEFGHDASGFITIRLAQLVGDHSGSPVDVCDPSIFFAFTTNKPGWLVYSRSPRVQDETGLGCNPEAAEPLYHRTEPFAEVTFYDEVTRTFTLDRRYGQIGETGWIDADYVDIMMPDRDGLPIQSFNIYTSSDGVNFFYAGTGNSGHEPVSVYGVDTSAVRAPSTRVDRSPPTVTVDWARGKVQGKRGLHITPTRIPAGLYGIRTTWTCGDQSVMGDPGIETRLQLNGNSADQPPLRCPQETWPSREEYVTILDDQGMTVEPPPGPEVNNGWNLYARQLRPHRILTFEDVSRHTGTLPDPDVSLPAPYFFNESYAEYYGAPQIPASSFSSSTAIFGVDPVGSTGFSRFSDEYRDTSAITTNALDPFDSATRGFPPGYPDIRETLGGDGNPLFTYASSRDDIPVNRHRWWFFLDEVLDAEDIALTTHAILRVTLRIRPGKTDSTTSSDGVHRFIAGDDKHVDIRCWDATAGAWTILRSEMGIGNGWFNRMGFPIEWNTDRLIIGEDASTLLPNSYRYLVWSINASDCVGFDIDEVQLELYRASTEVDPVPSADSVLQRGGIKPILDDTYTLKNPLAYRLWLEDGSEPGFGEWESIRPDNTAQWPVVVSALPIVGKKASSQETKVNFIGCASACFRMAGGGVLERIFQQEGLNWNGTMRHDWRFENYLNRVFILNEGESRWNYRFDGLATYPMGLPKPISGVTVDDENDGFGTSQGEIPGSTLYGDRCVEAELFAGRIISVLQPSPGAGVVSFDVEYYVVYKRYNPATGRSYVVRAEPAQLTRTQTINGSDAFAPTLFVELWLTPEPQATHIEIYRNRFATADYFLVSDVRIGPDGAIPDYSDEGIRITADVVDPATARLYVQFQDQIPVDDGDLTLPIEFETGRPLAAVMMKFNRGRLFFAPQLERTILRWTNITSPSGDINPEGSYVKHAMEPPVRESAAITCLSPYNDNVNVSCNTGMVGVQGLSDDLNGPSALSAGALAANGGWMGPDAFVDVDNIQYGMSRQGPAWLFGGEMNFIGPPIEGTLLEMRTDTDALFDVRCFYFRTSGISQVWFTYRLPGDPLNTRCLVFDHAVNESGESTQFWKEWTEMPVHGLAAARDIDGVEYPLLGGLNGRLYRHGMNATDAGLLIERDLATKPFELPNPVAFMTIQSTWDTSGEPDDVVMLDIWPDFNERALNQDPIPIRMGGNCGLTWAEAVSGDPDDFWGGNGEWPWTQETVTMGGVLRQIAYRLYLTWETWPIGKERYIGFETTGFNPFTTEFGERHSRANAGARRP